MMMIYIVLLALSAFTISIIGAIFSISGLAKLFSGAPVAVMFMAGALEFAKVVSAAFLQRFWAKSPFLLRFYLTVAVCILICITSMGIFGYLSSAYQKFSIALKNTELRIENLTKEETKLQDEIVRLQKSVEEIPANRVSKRIALQAELEPEIRKIKKRSFELSVQAQDANIEKLNYQKEIGPVIYVAKALNADQEVVSQWLIFLFVSIFDPLAIALVFATSHTIKLREDSLKTEAPVETLEMSA